MKSVKTSGLLTLAALAIIASPMAVAQDSGWYLGASAGRATATIDDPRITSGLLAGGFTTLALDDRNHDTGFKLQLGYQFNRYFALEGGGFELGKFGFNATTAPAGSFDGSTWIRGLNLDLVGTLPFTARFAGIARIGVTHAEAKDAFRGTGLVMILNPNPSQRATNAKVGLGLQYQFTPSVGMRVEAERYRISDAIARRGDIDLVSAGLVVRFGRKAAPMAPEPVAAAPAPEPVAAPVAEVPAPPAIKTQVYCSLLDLQFEVDEGEIQRADKERLSVVGTFLNKYPETTAVIEGHTDSVGTPEHNQKLSQQRADSVVAYLIESQHINPGRLNAVGYGSSRPVADNATEEGKRQNRRIGAVISCATDIEGLTVVPARITMALVVEFDRNKAEVLPQYGDDLRKVANFLKANPRVTATVEGHTGNLQGTPEMAMEISLQRARNVVTYLVDTCGISRDRLKAEGFGRSRQFAYNSSAEGQQDNRRVNIIINYPK